MKPKYYTPTRQAIQSGIMQEFIYLTHRLLLQQLQTTPNSHKKQCEFLNKHTIRLNTKQYLVLKGQHSRYNKVLLTTIHLLIHKEGITTLSFCVYSWKTVRSTIGKFSINITVSVFKSRTL